MNRISGLSKISTYVSTGFDYCKTRSKIGLVAGTIIFAVGLILCSYQGVGIVASSALLTGAAISIVSYALDKLHSRDQRLFNEAIEAGDKEIARGFLKKPGMILNHKHAGDPLQIFIKKGDRAFVQELLQHRADPNFDLKHGYDNYGLLVHTLIGYRDSHYYLELDLSQGLLNNDTYEKLKKQLEEKYLSVISELYNGGLSLQVLNQYSNNCFFSLIQFIYPQSMTYKDPFALKIAKEILKLEGIIDEKDHWNGTIPEWMSGSVFSPLSIFTLLGMTNAVEKILQESPPEKNNPFPLRAACLTGNIELFEKLKSHFEFDRYYYNEAIIQGHLHFVKYLHEKGFVDEKWYSKEEEKTPLWHAVDSNQSEIATYLLTQHQYNPKQIRAALFHAIDTTYDTVNVLLAGIKFENLDKLADKDSQENVLHHATRDESGLMIKLLVKAIPNHLLVQLIDQCSHFLRTPLHEATSLGHLQAVKELLAIGADVTFDNFTEDPSNKGYTPLHWVSRGHLENSIEIVKALVYASSSPSKYIAMQVDREGNALDIARASLRDCTDRDRIWRLDQIIRFLETWASTTSPLESNVQTIKGKERVTA